MFSHRVTLAVLLALLLMPSAASAAPDWAPALSFPVPSNAFGGLDEVLYQNGGIATEGFLEVQSISPLQTTLHLGTLAPGGGYSDQLTIPSVVGAVPTGPQIAVAPNGAAVAAWAELLGSNLETSPYRYRAAYRPAGGATWEAPFTIATDSERNKEIYEYLTPVIAPDGSAAVGIQHIATGDLPKGQNEPRYRVDVAFHPAGTGWQTPVRITPESESAESFALAFDGQGDLTAAYTLRFSE